jgi:hypothetical protein
MALLFMLFIVLPSNSLQGQEQDHDPGGGGQ